MHHCLFKAQCALNYILTEVLLLTGDDQNSNCSMILRPLSSFRSVSDKNT